MKIQLKNLIMKTKLFYGIALCVLFSSCIKDYIGHGSDKIKLTAENNIYEGDLYKAYIEGEILMVDAEIDALNKIIENGQGTDQTLTKLEAANKKRDQLKQETSFSLVPDFLLRRIPRPRPPCPNPQNCDFFGFDFVTSLSESQLRSISILDEEGNDIGGTTENQNTLPGTRNRATVDDFKIDEGYFGPITIKVITDSKERFTNIYTFSSFIQQ